MTGKLTSYLQFKIKTANSWRCTGTDSTKHNQQETATSSASALSTQAKAGIFWQKNKNKVTKHYHEIMPNENT